MKTGLSKILIYTLMALIGWIIADYYLIPGPVSVIGAVSFAVVFGVIYGITTKAADALKDGSS